MSWLVPVVHEVVDLPLALDTSNIKAIEAGLKAHKKGRPLINSIMVRPERMDALLPLAAEYDADFVGLLWGPEGMPRDENERGALCAELVYRATGEFGIDPERILIDPIQTPVNVQQGQIMSVLEFMKMFAGHCARMSEHHRAFECFQWAARPFATDSQPGHAHDLETSWTLFSYRRHLRHTAPRNCPGETA